MNNLLTDKTKEAFEEWYYYHEEYIFCHTREPSYSEYPFSMQYGVIVDFFDSVGIWITIDVNSGYCDVDINGETVVSLCPSRQKARTKAVKKANQIFNER